MISVKDLVKDRESISKYVSKTVHAKIGNSQLTINKIIENESDETITKDFSNLDYAHHLKKVITTDNRVLEIEDFPEINDRMHISGHFSPKNTLLFGKSIPKHDDTTSCFVLQVLPFRLRIALKSMIDEKDPSYFPYTDSEITKDCWVYWNGSTFLAYTTIDQSPDLYFAHRVRDVLHDIYKGSDLLQVATIGPCPIHPDINVYLFSKEKLSKYFAIDEISEISFSPFIINEKIIINYLLETEDNINRDIHRILLSIFWELHHYLEHFYFSMSTRSSMLITTEKCIDLFKDLSTCLLSIHGLQNRAFLRRSKKVKELGALSARINMLLADEYQLSIQLKDQQKDLIRYSKETPIKSLLIDYFQEHTTESECIDRQSITNTLIHADQVLSRHTVFNTQLISAVVGGIIGGITAVALIYLSTSIFE